MRARVALLAILALTSCAGPQKPFDVGVKDVATDVIYGAPPADDAPIPLPPVAPVVPVTLPPPPAVLPSVPAAPSAAPLPVAPRPETCRAADPLSLPATPATETIAGAPAVAAYPFRVDGRYEISGAAAERGVYPTQGTRSVVVPSAHPPLAQSAGDVSFDVVATLGTTTTTSTYLLDRDGAQPGLYLTRVDTRAASGTSTYAPEPALLALPLPATVGTRWQAFGVDPTTGMATSYNGEVGKHVRVDACGRLVDAIAVHLDGEIGNRCVQQNGAPRVCSPGTAGAGSQVDPTAAGSTTFTADYAYATQVGGLIVRDHVVTTTATASGTTAQDITATISRAPRGA